MLFLAMPAVAATEGAATAGAAQDVPASQSTASPAVADHIDINEYRVEGAKLLKSIEIEEAVYPFLGPDRSPEDVEKARGALEQAYAKKGYQAIAVEVPPQQVVGGVITLKVTETKIERLRVVGSRYYSLDAIKEEAPSVAEGKVPNFNEISRDIVALNRLPDRRVTPQIRAGTTPGTVDVDLNVEDKLPLHASLELNNRNSADTRPLRLNGTVHYDNLWQLGHSASLSFQTAPQRTEDSKVVSGSYLAPVPDVNWLSVLAYATKQDSNVNTLGEINVVGKGEIIGARAIMTLPGDEGFYHSLSSGIDYKHFDQGVSLGGQTLRSPITYYPITTTYMSAWQNPGAETQLDAGVTFHLRGMGSTTSEFDLNRTYASGNFIYLRGDVSHTRDLPSDLQLYLKGSGQLSNEPLISSEQFSAGGQETVRGYLESEVSADHGWLATIEMRSPSLSPWLKSWTDDSVNEWRFRVFADGGVLEVNKPLAEQKSTFHLASVGFGSTIKLLDNLQGSFDVGLPLISQTSTESFDPRVHFRLRAEY